MNGRLCNNEIGTDIMYNVVIHNNKSVKFFPDASDSEYWLFINPNHTNNLRKTVRLQADTIATQLETIASQVEQIEKNNTSIIALTNLVILSVNSGQIEENKLIATILEQKEEIEKLVMSVE
jgi:hypothetical protein